MKRIGIDARLYFQTGVGVYIRNFLHYLEEYAPTKYEFYIYVLKKDSSQIRFKNEKFIKREVNVKWHSFAEQLELYWILIKDNLDLMHFTYFSYPVFYKKKFIATIHDITPLVFKTGKASTLPGFMYDTKHKAFTYVLSQQVKNAAKIITPTHAVKKQLVDFFGGRFADKIVTIYEGVNYEFFNAKENVEMENTFNRPFLLYVGNFYPHKNVDRLIDAFGQLDQDVDLILAGPDNYFSNVLRQKIKEKQIKRIHFYHPSKIEDLVYLYRHTIALINPSLSEGFGLPIVEAAYFNTPIIASDLPVFKELLGNSYISFDPHSIEDIHDKLAVYLQQPQQPNYEHIVQKFSFETMVRDYLAILKEVDK